MRIAETGTLSPNDAAAVAAMAKAAATQDGLDALSEQTLIRIHSSRRGPWRHWLAWHGGLLVGYAFVDGLPEPTPGAEEPDGQSGGQSAGATAPDSNAPDANPPAVELVVDPAHRRRGVGGALLDAVLANSPTARVWAHGNLPAAAALAAGHDLRPVRDLWLMSTELGTGGAAIPLPEGFAVRAFTVADIEEFLALNARAFATHPEQGRLSSADLHERMTQPWFDPAGFLLVQDHRADPPRLAAFHWTKFENGVGEIYVLGIDPAYQGRGLAAPLTALGLRHLADRGARQVVLYVEGDNHPAVATYTRAGFSRAASHVMYAHR